jgi:hypothetical protein
MDNEVEDRRIQDKAILLLVRPLEVWAAKVQHLHKHVPEAACSLQDP